MDYKPTLWEWLLYSPDDWFIPFAFGMELAALVILI